MSFSLCFLVIAALAAPALGYSSGAPEDACVDMVPQHHTPAQTSAAPYTLTTSRKAIRGGDEIILTITGKGPSDKIRGFMVQARQGNNIVGSFKVDDKNSFVQLMDCGSGKGVI